jgi:hypothetical protein
VTNSSKGWVLENNDVSFCVSGQSGSWTLTDKRAQVNWGAASGEPWLAVLRGPKDDQKRFDLLLVGAELRDGALYCRFADPGDEIGGARGCL